MLLSGREINLAALKWSFPDRWTEGKKATRYGDRVSKCSEDRG